MTAPRPFLFLLLIFAFSGELNAQHAKVYGRLLDQRTKEALPFAVVQVKGTTTGTQTDTEGTYNLKLLPGQYTLLFKYIGYATREINVYLKAGDETRIDIQLEAENLNWNPIVITASRTTQQLEKTVSSMDLLPHQLVENRVDNNIETAIEQVSGVTVIDGQANIRGGSGFSYGAGSRVLVMVDDLPMLAGDANDVKWNFIPIEQMEQVEVLKGASSALFGSSALNGVINMRTVMPSDKPETQVNFFTGVYDSPRDEAKKWWSDSRMNSGMTFLHRQKFGNLSLVAGGQAYNDDGYRQGEKEERYRLNFHLRHTSEKVKGLTTGIAVNAQQARGGSFLIWQDDTTGALTPSGGLGEGSSLSEYKSDRLTIDPYAIYSRGKWIHKLRTRYFYSGNTNNTEQGSDSRIYYADYIAQTRIRQKVNLSIGTTGSMTRVQGELFDVQSGSNWAVYAQGDGDFGKLQTSLGFRMETGEISGRRFKEQYLFRSGVNYEAWRGGFVRTSYGQGFRFPSIAEQFIRTRVGNIVIYPNDSLIPERGWSAEIGVRQLVKISNWRGLVDVSAFRMEYKDMMEFSFGQWGNPFTDPLFGVGFKSVNIGNTRISGIEATVAGEGSIGQVKQSVLAGYTTIDPIQTDFVAARDTLRNTSQENILKYRFRHMFKFDTESSYRRFILGTSIRYYSTIENIDRAFNEAIAGVKSYRDRQPAGNWIVDCRIGYEVNSHLKFLFNIRNLFNEEFMTRPADIQAPRLFLFSIQLRS